MLEILEANNQSYHNQSNLLASEDKLLYTSTIDVCYLFRLVTQKKLERGGQQGLNM
jgi:hypothetical protein